MSLPFLPRMGGRSLEEMLEGWRRLHDSVLPVEVVRPKRRRPRPGAPRGHLTLAHVNEGPLARERWNPDTKRIELYYEEERP